MLIKTKVKEMKCISIWNKEKNKSSFTYDCVLECLRWSVHKLLEIMGRINKFLEIKF